MDALKQLEVSMESSSIPNPREQNLPGQSVWQASNYAGARFYGSKEVVMTEIVSVINLELLAKGQTISQQELDRLIDLSFRDFTRLPNRLKDSGHDSIIPQDFDKLMEMLIRKYVSQHKLITIRPMSGDSPTRGS